MRPRTTILAALTLWIALNPGLAATHERWAELVEKGRKLQWEKKPEEASVCYKQALAQAEAMGEDDPRLTGILLMLGRLYDIELGRHDLAARYLERQQDILIRKLGPSFQGRCDGMDTLARAYTSLGRYADAEKMFLQALEIRPDKFVNSNDFNFVLKSHLGDCYVEWKRYADAERMYKDILSYSLKVYPQKDDDMVRISYGKLGDLYRVTGQFDKSITAYKDCLKVCEILYRLHPEWSDLNYNEAFYQWNLGRAYDGANRLDEALASYRTAVKFGERAPDAWSYRMYTFYPGIAVIERKHGNQAEAEDAARQALELCERHKNKETDTVAKEIQWFLSDPARHH